MPKTEIGKRQRDGHDVFFSDALAVTDRNASTENAWAHYEVTKWKNKESRTLCVLTALNAVIVPGLLLCGTKQNIPCLLIGPPDAGWEKNCRSEIVSIRS